MADAATKRVLITGGLGFIGYHLAVRLSGEAGTEVVLADNLLRGRMDADARALVEKPNVHFIQCDLSAPESFREIGSGFDEVYHFAAVIGVKNVIERPESVLRVNSLSVIHLLDWFVAGGGQRLLFPSTSEAYAWTQQFHELPVPTPENVPLAITDVANPRASYAGSKIFGELAVTHYCHRHDKRFAIVRYHNVYGPRMGTEHVIPELYHRAAFQKQDPLVVYSTDHRRAFCYIDDAVDATIATLRVPAAAGGTFNVGNDGEEIAIGDLAKKILAVAGLGTRIEAKAAANDPVNRRCPDITRARAVLGIEPTVSLDEGLRRTCEWYGRWYGSHG